MDRHHRESIQLPQYLFRVQFPGCNTTWTDEGLSATDHINSPLTKDYLSDYLRSIEEHFLRDERLPIPYISLFSHREHAEIWALKLPSPDIRLLQISTRKLVRKSSTTNTQVLRLGTLVQKFRLTVPLGRQDYIEDAYLVSHHVPAKAIVDVRSRAQIEIGAFDTFFNHVCMDIGGQEDSQARSFIYSILARAEITTNIGEAIELLGCQREYQKAVGEGNQGNVGEFSSFEIWKWEGRSD